MLLATVAALTIISTGATPGNRYAAVIEVHASATCYGSTPCRACKNCRYCKHCAKEGGTCEGCK